MKKTLVALAALAATGAFAQSTVTLSGNIDFAAASITGSQTIAKGTTVSTGAGTGSTSVINLVAEEKITGGITITAKYGLDPRGLANDSLGVTNNTTSTSAVATTALANTVTGLARDEVFIGISGGFGNLRLGAPNSIGLNSFQVASPLGTGVGSGYTGGGQASTMTNSWVNTRYNRSVRYDSPSFNGITASVLYAPGNDQAAVGVAAGSGGHTALIVPNARAATEFGLRYAAGPLTVSYANVSTASQTNAGGWYAVGSSVAGTLKTSVNMINASFAMGSTTLYAGWNKGDSTAASSTATTATKGYRFGAKHTMGAIDLGASYTQQTSGTANTDASVTGLRADYNFSKTAAAYIGYENWDTGTAYASTATSGMRKITSVGLRKSF
jgi:predicted porin